ncbi:hypothetical protein [Streptomyces sp. NPDC015125]|uniref:hypothetical protein n=1 Tax=Streptomyces sp. NPDC015125 TaxID=3364938 RepID=UPI0036F783C8
MAATSTLTTREIRAVRRELWTTVQDAATPERTRDAARGLFAHYRRVLDQRDMRD